MVATSAEARRLADLPARTVVCGVGPVSAALATQRALLSGPRPGLVVSAGIGGAFAESGLSIGTAAVASQMVCGDLGAWDGEAFLGLSDLGLSVLPDGENPGLFPAWKGSAALASRLGLACGPFITVSGVTGSAEQARRLLARFPGALVEGMEGAGVAQAALMHGVPCAEIRGVSNLVGPRDRCAWQIGAALDALHGALHGALYRALAGLLHAPGGARPSPGPWAATGDQSATGDSDA